ncbi:4-alpha-glucanotransferase [Teredinibacter haidensis]|uniref:4-alpha-glucanotransferase n=1 Tax=Teredinibacter haidensis TaxID=2731755 RepID=UPI000948C3D5|nr:4-alpha-glucanotransferase [Teredinibacter haidensis]
MSDLDRIFYWRGITGEYQNYRGEAVKVPLANRLTLLKAMNVDVSSPQKVAKAAYELDVGPWRQFFPALQTVKLKPNTSAAFYINLHPEQLSKKLRWRLEGENGAVVDSGALLPASAPETGDYLFDGVRYSRRLITTAVDSPGYYQLVVTLIEPSATDKRQNTVREIEGVLAVAPATVFQPAWLEKGCNPWGFIIQLYTLRTESDWGVGDFSDLQLLVKRAAALGADIIGLNPLHALLPDIENNNSPYSPSDRRFINPLYIDPTSEQDYLQSNILHTEEGLTARKQVIVELRKAPLVNYSAVKNLKYPVFEQMYQQFRLSEPDSERVKCFEDFVSECGVALQQFALYEVARDRWPGCGYKGDISDSVLMAGAETEAFKQVAKAHSEAIRFHCYVQWLAHNQLRRCQQLAEESGMNVGLVRDLAVGADGGGAEAFSNPNQFCRGVSVGAPPDPLAEQGQNWGLPPMDPAHLRASGYKHFIQILRENMSRCGALRIDHAMALMRLWWCPPGMTADHGAYVYYPFEDMLALLCLESHLNQCAIIGEDLGVVPDEFRKAITEAGIFTNRVFYFEKENYSHFRAPEDYDVHALAMVNNHDVPTLKSWWDGSDLILRDRLGIFEEGVDYAAMVDQRSRDKYELLNFLEAKKMLPDPWRSREIEKPADDILIYALLVAVSRVASRLFVIQLEDVLLMDSPVNVPGTYKEHPNWQRKISKSIEAVFDAEKTIELLKRINSERRCR